MLNQAPLPLTVLRTLAPAQLVSYRSMRFTGETLSVRLDDFEAGDRHILETVYHTLLHLLQSLQAAKEASDGVAAILALLQQLNWPHVVRAMQRFGTTTLAQHCTPRLEAAIHDLRGGSFLALSVTLQLLTQGKLEGNNLLRAFFLTRDHLKMMRNGVPDLDPVLYTRDRQTKGHSVQLLVEKWSQAMHQLASNAATIRLDCQFSGNVSERCIEFAALDRVLYNLINNAVRHTADQQVFLSIFPVNDQSIRLVVYNRMEAAQAGVLRERFGTDLSDLFQGGFTTGGTGLGLRICAEFVADAYGVHGLARCLAEGYVGARVINDFFVAWFHWPVAAD